MNNVTLPYNDVTCRHAFNCNFILSNALNIVVPFLKKLFKAIIWLVISIVLLVIAIIVIIQIPAIQTRLTEYAVSFITSKTHTRVELDKISISFPKSVLIKGIYLDDKEQDTLFYAAEAKINLNIVGLLRKEIVINSFELEGANFNINRSEKDSLFNFDFLLIDLRDTTGRAKAKSRKNGVWTFSLDKAGLTDIRIRYDDKYGGKDGAKSILADISRLKLSDLEIGFQPDLKIKIGHIDLDETSFAYITPGQTGEKNVFDPYGLRYEHIMLAAADLSYADGKAEASLKKFSAVDQNNFAIEKFETIITMDPNSLSAKSLQIKTAGSYIDADVNIHYSSLASLKDSIQSVILKAEIRELSLKTTDINYFLPELNTPAFFRNGNNITSISGSLNGTLAQLNGKTLIISTGNNTILKTDFKIDGLPEFETANFYFPNLTLHTGREDIEMIAGPLMPENIELPAMISTQISFDGQIKAFKSKIGFYSSFGSADADLAMGRDESYSGKVRIMNFDLGMLLKNRETFGPLTLTADFDGQGYDKESIRARIEAEVSQIYFNQYNYHSLSINAGVTGREFEGKINLNDENAVLDLEWVVNLDAGRQQYVLRLNVPGADLKKLNLIEEDIQISLTASVNLNSSQELGMIGDAGINNMMVSHQGENYVLGSLLYAAINEPEKNSLNLNDALIGINFNGTFFPADFPIIFNRLINNYFPFSDDLPLRKNSELMAFDFEIQLHDNNILSGFLLPELMEFIPGTIHGSFDEAKNELILNAAIKRVNYGGSKINDFEIDVNSDGNGFNYKISSVS
ncbi:MAG: hypothetical protein JW731_03430, partial [Bacteroidales bacterium]|nr:hypothetical protein [Bacteroidales bacterium]